MKIHRRPRPEGALMDWLDLAMVGLILFIVGGLAGESGTCLTGYVVAHACLFRAVFIRDTGDHAKAHAQESNDGR